MEAIYNQREKMTDFIRDNKQNFQDKLLSEAVNVASKINDILETGNIDLLKNAQKLTLYVVEQKEEQLIAFAQQEGVAWAEQYSGPCICPLFPHFLMQPTDSLPSMPFRVEIISASR
ncbi:hypothetical protein [Priestia megaterium]|uniref:hypothetical protein n=1 Tax=Priestia megaterium TaxID=1404 RepID=UPI001D48F93A|nr:hypothetical protein [Priestia megaterium]CAH0308271.1 hypothetical protein SRABI82_04822 [Priestia megaterium]